MGEFRFGQDLVRALLREQHPDLAGRGKPSWEPAGWAALEHAVAAT